MENNYQPRAESSEESMGVGFERIQAIYDFYSVRNLYVIVKMDVTFVCTSFEKSFITKIDDSLLFFGVSLPFYFY